MSKFDLLHEIINRKENLRLNEEIDIISELINFGKLKYQQRERECEREKIKDVGEK